MKKTILKAEIRKILLEEDPMGIYFPEDKNIDEYDKEVEMIIERLNKCRNQKELLEMLWNIFEMQFGISSAGQKERYEKIANKVWRLIMEDNPKS